MNAQLHLSAVLSKWADAGHTQVALATLCGLAPSGISRMFKGELHPSIDTFATIISGIAPEFPQLARDLVEAYLLDHIPDGNAPDGRPWVKHVKIYIEEITARVSEGGDPISEIDLAKMWFESRCNSPEGQRWLLTMYHWATKPKKY